MIWVALFTALSGFILGVIVGSELALARFHSGKAGYIIPPHREPQQIRPKPRR